MKDDSRIVWGIILLTFGFIFLIKQLGILPPNVEDFIFDFRNLPFAFGIIFLIAHKNKSIGIVLIGVGLIFYLKDIIIWTKKVSELIWPLLIIGAGIILLTTRNKKESLPESSEITKKEEDNPEPEPKP